MDLHRVPSHSFTARCRGKDATQTLSKVPPSLRHPPSTAHLLGRDRTMLRTRVRGFTALLFIASFAGAVSAQPTPDQQAEALLNAGRKAYNEGNPQFAADRFTELLTKFGGYKEANTAQIGLGLALLDLPDPNYQKAYEAFIAASNDAKFPERGLALYQAGVCQRGMGHKEL